MKKLIIAVAAMAASGMAVAGPSWTYAEAGYIVVDGDDNDGYSVAGSFGFADIWHVRADYSDVDNVAGDTDGYELVAGIHPAISDNTDFVFEISYFDFDIGAAGELDGYGLEVGLRSMFTDNVELSASVGTDDQDFSAGGDNTDVSVTAGGQYYFTDNISLGVEVNVGDGNSAEFGVRYSF